jgi:hypothetical protein
LWHGSFKTAQSVQDQRPSIAHGSYSPAVSQHFVTSFVIFLKMVPQDVGLAHSGQQTLSKISGPVLHTDPIEPCSFKTYV